MPYVRNCTFPSLDGDFTIQADDGLYNFLSPQLESFLQFGETRDCFPVVKIPRWFQSGEGISSLLQEAEGLDWFADSGRVISDLTASTNTMCQDAIDGLKPPPVAIPIPYTEATNISDLNECLFVKEEEGSESQASMSSSEACSTSESVSSASPHMSPQGPHGIPHSHILGSSSPMFSLPHSMHDFEDMNRVLMASDWMLPSSHHHYIGHHSNGLEDELMVSIEGLYPEALSIY